MSLRRQETQTELWYNPDIMFNVQSSAQLSAFVKHKTISPVQAFSREHFSQVEFSSEDLAVLVSQLSVQQQLGWSHSMSRTGDTQCGPGGEWDQVLPEWDDVCPDGLQLLPAILQPLLGAGRILPQCLYLRLVSQRPLHHRHHRHGLQDRHHDHASGQVGAVREDGEGRK